MSPAKLELLSRQSRAPAAAAISTSTVSKGLCFAIVVSWLFTFENVAEFKFFGGQISWLRPIAGLPFAVYTWWFDSALQDTYRNMPCHEMSNSKLLKTTLHPILFKQCIPKNLVEDDLVTFPDSSTNIFPPCGRSSTPVRRFTYTSLNGTSQNITEVIPCASTMLQEKVDFFKQHQPMHDGPWNDVNINFLNAQDELVLEQDFARKGLLPEGFSFRRYASITIVGHFLGSGTTNVDYFHSHMDRFFSFGIQATKVWELIHPKHHDGFDYEWSGNACVLTREKKPVPHVVVEQEPGDVLFVAPWWLHKTRFDESAADKSTVEIKNLNVNLHSMTTRSVVGMGALIFMRWLEQGTWFYASDKTKEAYREHGKEFIV